MTSRRSTSSSGSFGALIGEFVPFFVALSIMLAADVRLTIVMLAFAPFLVLSIVVYRRLTKNLYREARQSVSLLNQNMQENLAGLTVVQLHGREQENLGRYTAINNRNRSAETRANVVDNIAGAFNSALADIAIAAVLWFGDLSALDETITLGTVVLFTRYIDMLFTPIVALGDNYNLLFRSMASGERIFQALDWNAPAHEPETPAELEPHLAGPCHSRADLRLRRGTAGPPQRFPRGATCDASSDRRSDRLGQEHPGPSARPPLRPPHGLDPHRQHRRHGHEHLRSTAPPRLRPAGLPRLCRQHCRQHHAG